MAYVCILLVFFVKFGASLSFLDSFSSCNVRGLWSFLTLSTINSSSVNDFCIKNDSRLYFTVFFGKFDTPLLFLDWFCTCNVLGLWNILTHSDITVTFYLILIIQLEGYITFAVGFYL